eukprot:NODE_658_length_1284_cov_76.492653_g619_i0.p1 GENE.NODE_658_length_1284_cov_76.492653_g619_i0~~NODE_658_length_1284_cov_76.492653_g619_i0.p1  ORF type:complete len:172 (-),score=19.28 NODE_658_length_1284_cov_76.492653_g619_i0:415-930(-)
MDFGVYTPGSEYHPKMVMPKRQPRASPYTYPTGVSPVNSPYPSGNRQVPSVSSHHQVVEPPKQNRRTSRVHATDFNVNLLFSLFDVLQAPSVPSPSDNYNPPLAMNLPVPKAELLQEDILSPLGGPMVPSVSGDLDEIENDMPHSGATSVPPLKSSTSLFYDVPKELDFYY